MDSVEQLKSTVVLDMSIFVITSLGVIPQILSRGMLIRWELCIAKCGIISNIRNQNYIVISLEFVV